MLRVVTQPISATKATEITLTTSMTCIQKEAASLADFLVLLTESWMRLIALSNAF